MTEEVLFPWSREEMLEVNIDIADNFLKIKETLSRIGVASSKQKTLTQSAHILHKQGKYYIAHFKELFLLDGKTSNISYDDIDRRNAIAILLDDWGLLKIVNKPQLDVKQIMTKIKVLSYKDKNEWALVTKYNLGKRQDQQDHE